MLTTNMNTNDYTIWYDRLLPHILHVTYISSSIRLPWDNLFEILQTKWFIEYHDQTMINNIMIWEPKRVVCTYEDNNVDIHVLP